MVFNVVFVGMLVLLEVLGMLDICSFDVLVLQMVVINNLGVYGFLNVLVVCYIGEVDGMVLLVGGLVFIVCVSFDSYMYWDYEYLIVVLYVLLGQVVLVVVVFELVFWLMLVLGFVSLFLLWCWLFY